MFYFTAMKLMNLKVLASRFSYVFTISISFSTRIHKSIFKNTLSLWCLMFISFFFKKLQSYFFRKEKPHFLTYFLILISLVVKFHDSQCLSFSTAISASKLNLCCIVFLDAVWLKRIVKGIYYGSDRRIVSFLSI